MPERGIHAHSCRSATDRLIAKALKCRFRTSLSSADNPFDLSPVAICREIGVGKTAEDSPLYFGEQIKQ
jgi:hypothetical protein